MTNQIHNKNIETETVITSPIELRQQISVSVQGKENILSSRNTVEDIFLGNDDRLIVIVGPCSIHDINAAKEYALKLLTLQKEVEKSIFIVMRVYFEKPRTTVGWKGLISDPDMDNSLDVEKGLRQGRELLAWLAEKNIPIIFYFSGTHEDYHKPTDTVDKIEFDLLQQRTKLIFHTAWELANRDDRIQNK